jgi:TorA maturation chaperone TorD
MKQALSFATADDGEELARAELYGLLARLWVRAAGCRTAGAVPGRRDRGAAARRFLESPWQSLVAAMRATTPEAAAAEYDALFGGVGKPEVLLYGSYYLAGFLNERPLAQLRADLDARPDPRRSQGRDRGPCRLRVRGHALPDRRRRRGSRQP